jgi:hypothetical protein
MLYSCEGTCEVRRGAVHHAKLTCSTVYSIWNSVQVRRATAMPVAAAAAAAVAEHAQAEQQRHAALQAAARLREERDGELRARLQEKEAAAATALAARQRAREEKRCKVCVVTTMFSCAAVAVVYKIAASSILCETHLDDERSLQQLVVLHQFGLKREKQ